MGISQHWLEIRWRIEGSANILLPPFAGQLRRDGLWKSTCFEMFVQPSGQSAYTEYNFAPSECWAAYDFTAPRQGMAERAMSRAPVIVPRAGKNILLIDVALPITDVPALAANISLTAVLEEKSGAKSYWAPKHPQGDPDFHHPDCFTLQLPPPSKP